MKVLVITSDTIEKRLFHDVYFLSWKEANEKIQEINFSEYDGIILDADSIQKDKKSLTPHIVTGIQGYYSLQNSISPSIITDLFQQKNSFFTLIGNPQATVATKPISSLLGFNISVKEKSGNNIVIEAEEGDLYFNYWKKIKEYTYYIESLDHPGIYDGYIIDKDDNILNRSRYVLGTCFYFESHSPYFDRIGPISFVPPLATKQETIEKILAIHTPNTCNIENTPLWAKDYFVVGQHSIDAKITKITENIDKLRQKKDTFEEQRSNMRNALNCLWATDKQLEYETKKMFHKSGFNVIEPNVKNEEEFCIKYKSKKFVVEVKSTQKEYINKDGLRQVNEWRDDKECDGDDSYKALLIISNQTSLDPEKRNPNPLPDNLSSFAKKHNVCVVTINQLFALTQQINDKRIATEELANILYKTNGLLVIDDTISNYKQSKE